jgi:cytochrome c peroxidase
MLFAFEMFDGLRPYGYIGIILYMILTGCGLPTPEEVRAFLASGDAQKRTHVVAELLERPEYADHWTAKWADLLRPNPYRVGIKAVMNYDAWIRESFRQNKPYDQFVRELITAQGSTFENGASVMFRDRRDPPEITTLVSQLFLGIRLECAKCHHHPFEKWSQQDYYGFQAFFAQVGRKKGQVQNQERIFHRPGVAQSQNPSSSVFLVARTSSNAAALANSIVREIHAVYMKVLGAPVPAITAEHAH